MFHLTSTDFGQAFITESFESLDDACAYLNELEYSQDCAYSYTRELAISQLKDQITDYLLEESED
jgi:hypothetical protein